MSQISSSGVTDTRQPNDAAAPANSAGSVSSVSSEHASEMRDSASARGWLRGVLAATPSWLVSMIVHTVVLLVLALLTLPPEAADVLRQLVVEPGSEDELETLDELVDEPPEEIRLEATDLATFESSVQPQEVDVSVADDMEASAVAVELSDFGLEQAPRNDLLATVGSYSGDALSGRGAGKSQLLRSGGSEGSEQAVALALKWLAAHQMQDGGWSFDHRLCPKCRGQCRNPGELAEARNAATGLALLPFLGAGQTHMEGQYRDVVKTGLYYLVTRMKVGPNGGALNESGGSMYAHGIASIALCEAYAMTHDKGLYAPAQQAVNFICYAQDPVGGGWRYTPRQPGDTSVVGWQIMALKSGHMAYLQIPPITVQKAFRFLDSVQANSGANYGYTDPGSGLATTAIGLLCRMYLGWKRDNPALERGVEWLSQKGPSNNMYHNYYATQVMRHWEGEQWTKWNAVMRDQLVNSQDKRGHEEGSWAGGNDHGATRGGRLYTTAMSAMVLEVYYRHLPIYRKQSTEEDFPLD
jgi:hypothetical protein